MFILVTTNFTFGFNEYTKYNNIEDAEKELNECFEGTKEELMDIYDEDEIEGNSTMSEMLAEIQIEDKWYKWEIIDTDELPNG